MDAEDVRPSDGHFYSTINADEGALRFRFDPERILQRLDLSLSGEAIETVQSEDGSLYQRRVKKVPSLVNDEGRHTILDMAAIYLSPQSLQADIGRREDFNAHLAMVREEMARMIMRNRQDWEINIRNYGIIMHKISEIVRVGCSHQIEHNTMKLLSQSSEHREVIADQQRGRLLDMFRRNGR
jgi:hypothetical protein